MNIKDYIEKRIIQLKKNRKYLADAVNPEKREVAIRQTQGRILELQKLKYILNHE